MSLTSISEKRTHHLAAQGRRHMRKAIFLSATGLALLVAGTAAAQTTVNWLHIEQNPEMVGYWEEIARSFEAENPDVTVEMSFLENRVLQAEADDDAAVGRASGYFLQLGRRRLPRPGRGRLPARHLRSNGRRMGRPLFGGQRRCLHPRGQGLRRPDARLAGRLLVQQGPDGRGRCRSRRNRDLGRFPRCRAAAEGRRHRATGGRWRRQVAAALLLDASRHPPRRPEGLRGGDQQ